MQSITFILIHHTISHWPYLANSKCEYEKLWKNNMVELKKF